MGFKFTVRESKFVPLDDRIWYPMRLLSVETDELVYQGTPQPKFKFNFEVLDPEEFIGRPVHGMVNQPKGNEITERHGLYGWLTALLDGRPPSVDEEIDFPDQFIGKIVLGQVKSKEKEYQGRGKMVFQNVSRIAVCPPDERARLQDRGGQIDEAVPAPGSQASVQPPAPEPTPHSPAEHAPTPEPANPEPTPSATAEPPTPEAENTGGTVTVDGEEIDCPF